MKADTVGQRGLCTSITPGDILTAIGSLFVHNPVLSIHYRFIEENHEAKLASREQQMKQQSRPGAPSQEMMSYWGKPSQDSWSG